MFQGNFKWVSRAFGRVCQGGVFHGHSEGCVREVCFKEGFKGVSKELQESLKSALRKLQGYFKKVSS